MIRAQLMARLRPSLHIPPNFSFDAQPPMYANEPLFELNWRSVMADAIADRAAQRGERSTAPHDASALAAQLGAVMVTTATARAAHFAAQAPLIASMASPARDPASCVYTKHTEPARSPDLSAWFGLMATVQEEAAHMEVDEARHAAGSASVDAAIPFGDGGGDGSRSLDGSEAASDLSAAYTFSEHGAAAAPMPMTGKA